MQNLFKGRYWIDLNCATNKSIQKSYLSKLLPIYGSPRLQQRRRRCCIRFHNRSFQFSISNRNPSATVLFDASGVPVHIRTFQLPTEPGADLETNKFLRPHPLPINIHIYDYLPCQNASRHAGSDPNVVGTVRRTHPGPAPVGQEHINPIFKNRLPPT